MKYKVIKEIGCQDSKPFAVVISERFSNGEHLRVINWYEKEDDARASAHSLEFGE